MDKTSLNFAQVFMNCENIVREAKKTSKPELLEKLHSLLDLRRSDGLSTKDAALLLSCLEHPDLRIIIRQKAKELRNKLFQKNVITMSPLELTSFCQSQCEFCSWRSTNKTIPRLRTSFIQILKQAINIAESTSTRHIELAGGDDLEMVKSHLSEYIKNLKKELVSKYSSFRISLCMTPLTSKQYGDLHANGLDAVLNWQETYDYERFHQLIVNGVKKHGLRDDYTVDTKLDGFVFRAEAQKRIIDNGMQAGLGVMLGASKNLLADILCTTEHAKHLIQYKDGNLQPLIFGIPTWNNTFGTQSTENAASLFASLEETFPAVSAAYLLITPDSYAWPFANCRVSPEIQVKAIDESCFFTSTEVSLAPGGYLKDEAQKNEYSKIRNHTNNIADSEQFSHFTYPHSFYINLFNNHEIKPTNEENFLKNI
ncbi:MAG: hypothetical protein R3A80_13040 [Bdellovibrionota bacterium]